MLKLCFNIICLCFGMVIVYADKCDYFKYIQRNNEWVGIMSIPVSVTSDTKFETEWYLKSLNDNVQYQYPQSLTYVLNEEIKPVEVTFTFANQNSFPTLTKVIINDKLVCKGVPPDSYEGKIFVSGKVTAMSFGGKPPTTSNTYQTVAQRPQIANQYSGNPFLNRLQPGTTTTTTRRTTTTTTPRPTPPSTTRITTTVTPVVDRRIVTATTQQAVNEVCGRRTSTFTPFIVGGRQIILGQIPWLVAIMAKVRGGVFFVCGGSLISARTVISAAHCFQSRLTKDDVVLYLGKHQLDNYNERFETREPSNIIINTDYSMTIPPDADLAIIQFDLPVGFTDKISPICLWTGAENVHEIAGQRGFVAGWGSDGLRNNVTNIPKMVDTSIVSDNVCRTDTHIPPQFVTSRVLCAGNLDDTGPCSGDSGSGLMIHTNGRWQLRAIVSGGPKIDGECNLRSYVLYCDLAKHRSWLTSNILY